MIKNFEEIRAKAVKGDRSRLVVADAAGKSVIDALTQATDMGMIEPILVGDETKIAPLVEEMGLEGARIIDIKDPVEIAEKCVALIRKGEGDMLMKGKLSTPVLMKAVLDKQKGLRKGKLLSHVAVMELAGYPKLMTMTDGGIVINPDLGEKAALIENAAEVVRGLDIEVPKVACLAAIEKITDKQPETLHAVQLVKMAERGQLGKVKVEGPIATDVLLSHEAAKAKGIQSEMTLDADIVLVPNIAVCNAFVKGMIYLANARVAGVVMGAACPIVLLSRSDTAEVKLDSIALATVI
ncbi:MAG: phosphate acyltransferase [bacterium]